MPKHTHSRASDGPAPWYERYPLSIWHTCTDPLRDKPGMPISMTKIIAGYFAYLTGYSITQQHGHVDVNTLWLALASLSAAFGKSTFNFLLSKVALQSTSTQSDSREVKDERVEHTITERRDVNAGFEATP